MGKSGSEGRGEQTTARERGTGGSPLTLRPGYRVGAGLTPAPPTPPGVRIRTGRFAQHPGNGGRDR
jgi:hypothetical protein